MPDAKDVLKGCAPLFFLGLFAALMVGAFGLLLLYGVVVIIFRLAFGVELPNPFH